MYCRCVKISVIGCGYLGAVHAAALASAGHEVVGYDVDSAKIASLASGRAPFFEPELDDLLAQGLEAGRLVFTHDISDIADAVVHFVAVGTPQRDDGAADLRHLDAAIEGLLPLLTPGMLVAGKSTVPVGTAARVAERIAGTGAVLAWNPEFLREGFAVRDTLDPDRLVYGVAPGDDESVRVLDEVYSFALARETPRLVTDLATAELVKVSANAFLATKISFINAMAEVAETVGADVTHLADAIGLDARIGRRFLNAGVGFGGGCLPKDIRAFVARAEELGVGESVAFLREVDAINLRRRDRVVHLVNEAVEGTFEGRQIAVLGLAFKPESDDIRDSPALDVASRLVARGATVHATDPKAIENARRRVPELRYHESWRETVAGADVVVLVTEWAEFVGIDPVEAARLAPGATVIDGRNALDPDQWRSAGWTYRGLGRSAV